MTDNYFGEGKYTYNVSNPDTTYELQYYQAPQMFIANISATDEVIINWENVKATVLLDYPYADFNRSIALMLMEARRQGAAFGDIPINLNEKV